MEDSCKYFGSTYEGRKNGAKEITIDNYRRYLNSLFDWCQSEDIITKNPVKKIDKIRGEKNKRTAFSDIEIEKMRSQLTNGKTYTARIGKQYEKELKLRNIAIFETLLSTRLSSWWNCKYEPKTS